MKFCRMISEESKDIEDLDYASLEVVLFLVQKSISDLIEIKTQNQRV